MPYAAVGTAIQEVHTAVYSTLMGDSQLVALINGVFDFTPQNQAFPYVVLGDVTELLKDVFDQRARELTITLHVWSRDTGFQEVEAILNRIDALLDRGTLLAGLVRFHQVSILYENLQVVRDIDGITRHAALRYRILVEQN